MAERSPGSHRERRRPDTSGHERRKDDGGGREREREREHEHEPRRSGTRSVARVVARAREDLQKLLGQPVERVSSVVPDNGGWRLTLDVVELARIPDSTSVLGCYEVVLDGDGEVLEYERVRRYYRNRTDEEGL